MEGWREQDREELAGEGHREWETALASPDHRGGAELGLAEGMGKIAEEVWFDAERWETDPGDLQPQHGLPPRACLRGPGPGRPVEAQEVHSGPSSEGGGRSGEDRLGQDSHWGRNPVCSLGDSIFTWNPGLRGTPDDPWAWHPTVAPCDYLVSPCANGRWDGPLGKESVQIVELAVDMGGRSIQCSLGHV